MVQFGPAIAVREAGGEAVEVELEEDLSITLATLRNEFESGVAGLSYINPKTGLRRILRISTDGRHDEAHYVTKWDAIFLIVLYFSQTPTDPQSSMANDYSLLVCPISDAIGNTIYSL